MLLAAVLVASSLWAFSEWKGRSKSWSVSDMPLCKCRRGIDKPAAWHQNRCRLMYGADCTALHRGYLLAAAERAVSDDSGPPRANSDTRADPVLREKPKCTPASRRGGPPSGSRGRTCRRGPASAPRSGGCATRSVCRSRMEHVSSELRQPSLKRCAGSITVVRLVR